MRAIIGGGGIGGISAALALKKQGIDVVVIEQAKAISEVGAGVSFTSNGVHAIRYLGCYDRIVDSAVPIASQIWRAIEDDEVLYTLEVGAAAERIYGAPSYFMHRADLLAALLAGIDSSTLRLGTRAVAFDERPDGVTVRLDNGEEITADLLVGADGLKSAVREWRFGPEEPRFIGMACWRSVFPSERLKTFTPGQLRRIWYGSGRSIIAYPIRAGAFYNFAGFVPAAEVRRESWTMSGDLTALHESFGNCSPQVTDMIQAIDQAFITGLYFRDPIEDWSTARTTLLGDSAHPTLPTAGQGAQMAVEDAITLASCLARFGESRIPEALKEYAARRYPRANRVLTLARANERRMNFNDPVLIKSRLGRFRGLQQIDPTGSVMIGWVQGHNPVKALDEPVETVGASSVGERERVKPKRPEARRAFDLWRGALTAEDHAGSWPGERAGYERFCAAAFPPPQGCKPVAISAGGVPALKINATDSNDGPTVLHFHGGGFTIGSAQGSVAVAHALAVAAGGNAVTVDYRLGPEHPFPAALDDALTAYRWLLGKRGDSSEIVVTGEDAGGALAISLGMALRDRGEPLPRLIYAVSPMADLTLTAPSIDGCDGDPWHDRETLIWMAASYLHDEKPTHPLISPVHGNFAGLPPLLIHAARQEALFDDSVKLAAAAQHNGVDIIFEPFDDTVHSFVLFDFLPETKRALAQFGSLVRDRADALMSMPAK